MGAVSWREQRRRSARAAIVEAAWSLVAELGLAGLSMRELAGRAGVTTPTLYAYFDSKNAIYDALFGQAAAEFAAHMAADYPGFTADEIVVEGMRRYVGFCLADVPRYQLLFQRTIPGFEPSPDSYVHAVAALEGSRRRLAAAGIVEDRHLDMLTAITTGLVDQQVSNDPGGDRWVRLVDETAEMFLSHCRASTPRRSQRGQRPKR